MDSTLISYDSSMKSDAIGQVELSDLSNKTNTLVVSSTSELIDFIRKNTVFEGENMLVLDDLAEYTDLAANIVTTVVYGYTSVLEYQQIKDYPIVVTDFQNASKLGITAHTTYYMTTVRVTHIKSLLQNMRASVAASPYCGLLMNNIIYDSLDPLSLQRGYSAAYLTNLFDMWTHLIFFRKNTGDIQNTIWYPCDPLSLQWNVNILSL